MKLPLKQRVKEHSFDAVANWKLQILIRTCFSKVPRRMLWVKICFLIVNTSLSMRMEQKPIRDVLSHTHGITQKRTNDRFIMGVTTPYLTNRGVTMVNSEMAHLHHWSCSWVVARHLTTPKLEFQLMQRKRLF